jgi:hypothetical protein
MFIVVLTAVWYMVIIHSNPNVALTANKATAVKMTSPGPLNIL